MLVNIHFKMKFFVFSFLLFAVAAIACAEKKDSSEEIDEIEDLQKQFNEIFNDFKEGGEKKSELVQNVTNAFEKVCPGGSDKIQEKANELIECIGKLDEGTTYCHDLENEIPKCFKPMVGMFEECLPEDSKTLPNHLILTVQSIFKHLCSINGEHIFELANFCIFDETESYKKCEHKVKAKLEKLDDDDHVPTRDEVCRSFTSLRPCFVKHVEEACVNPVTRETYTGFYDALIKPCVDINVIENDGNE